MLKKSTSCANSSAIMAAAGVSIMMPKGIPSSNLTPCSRSSALSPSRRALTRRTSSTEMTMGTMMARLPKAEAQRMAAAGS